MTSRRSAYSLRHVHGPALEQSRSRSPVRYVASAQHETFWNSRSSPFAEVVLLSLSAIRRGLESPGRGIQIGLPSPSCIVGRFQPTSLSRSFPRLSGLLTIVVQTITPLRANIIGPPKLAARTRPAELRCGRHASAHLKQRPISTLLLSSALCSDRPRKLHRDP